MASLEHSRYKVFSPSQHPLKHNLNDFMYNNPAAPGVATMEDAIDYLFNVIYPQTKPTVTDLADRPVVNNIGDYVNVTNGVFKNGVDDTDGYWTAGYMWAQYDGDAAPTWHLVTVFDWGADDVTSAMVDRTKLLYFFKKGLDDPDAEVGFEGQSLYGGATANKHLILNANNGDSDPSVHTGFIKLNDDTIPTINSADASTGFVLGGASNMFKEFYSRKMSTAGMNIYDDVIEALAALTVKGDTTFENDVVANDLTSKTQVHITDGTDTTTLGQTWLSYSKLGEFIIASSFGGGAIAAVRIDGSLKVSDFFKVGDIHIHDVGPIPTIESINGNPTIEVKYNTLKVVGLLGSSAAINHIGISLNGITTLATDADLVINPNGTGILDIQANTEITGTLLSGDSTATKYSLANGKVVIDGGVISGNSSMEFAPAANLITRKTFQPNVDGSASLGTSSHRFDNLYLKTNISDGTSSFNITDLLKFRDASTGAVNGNTLQFDGSKWIPTTAGSGSHGSLTDLGADDHAQYALLAGRATGQTLIGGVANTESLVFRGYIGSTGLILNGTEFFSEADTLSLGKDGSPFGSAYINNLNGTGEIKGLRVENRLTASLTDANASNKGKLVFDTEANTLLVDNGGAYQVVGNRSYKATFTETTLIGTHDVSPVVAMDAVWQIKDQAGEVVYMTIKATNINEITISSELTIPAGNYRLIGVEA